MQFHLKCVLPLYYVQRAGQGEALLLSQVGKQNLLFDVLVWPCSGNPEARLGRGGGQRVDGVCVEERYLCPSLVCHLTDHRARPPLCLTASHLLS